MKKVINHYGKYFLLGIGLFIVIMVGIYQFYMNEKSIVLKDEMIGKEVIDAKEITQIITSSQKDLSKIRLYFNETPSYYDEEILITVRNLKNKKQIYRKKVSDGELNMQKKYYDIKFSKQKDSLNQKYEIKIHYHKVSENQRIQFTYLKDESHKILLDENKIDGSLSYSLGYYSSTNVFLFYSVVFAFFIISFSLGIYFLSHPNLKIELVFLVSAIFIYSFYILLMPTYTSHDELYHFQRAYEISEGNLLSDVYDQRVESLLPVALGEAMNFNYLKVNYRTIAAGFKNGEIDERMHYDMSTVAVYSPMQYLPQAAGIKLASLFSNNIMVQAYTARFFNAIFSIVLLFFAIKLIPFGKKILFTLAFSPIAIEGFTSMSADAITVSVAFLFFAYLLWFIIECKRNIKKRDYFFLLAMSIILALCKIVYIPLVFLVFLLPKEKFAGKKQYLLFTISIVVIAIICNLGWLKIASKYLEIAKQGTSSSQVSFIFHHPITYVSLFFYSLFSNLDMYLLTAFGGDLCWSNLVHNLNIVPIGMIIVTILASITDSKLKKKMSFATKVFFGLVSVIIVGLIFTSLFVQFTKVGSTSIVGVQGRYFLPILPLLFMIIGSFKFSYTGRYNCDKIIVVLCVLLNISSLLTTIVTFL